MALTITDTELIPALHRGDPAAFEAIYHQYAQSILFFVRQIVSDKLVAEDITVVALTKAFTRNKDFSTVQKLKSFLFTTANNAALDFLKTKTRHDRVHQELKYLNDDQVDVELAYLTTEATRAIHAAIESLPVRPREVIRMVFLEGKKLPEIAQELNLSYNTVQVYRARGLEELRVQLIKNKLLPFAVLNFSLALLQQQ